MQAMNSVAGGVAPAGGTVAQYHARKHAVFQRMYADQMAYAETMAGKARQSA